MHYVNPKLTRSQKSYVVEYKVVRSRRLFHFYVQKYISKNSTTLKIPLTTNFDAEFWAKGMLHTSFTIRTAIRSLE